jgi:hypothetical protein
LSERDKEIQQNEIVLLYLQKWSDKDKDKMDFIELLFEINHKSICDMKEYKKIKFVSL